MNIWSSKSIKPKQSLFYINHNWEVISTSIKVLTMPCLAKTTFTMAESHVDALNACTSLPSICTCLWVYAKIHRNKKEFPPLPSRTPPQKKRTSNLPLAEKQSHIHESATTNFPRKPVAAPKKALLPPMPNAEENPAELSVDDSKVSSNGNCLNDTLEDV